MISWPFFWTIYFALMAAFFSAWIVVALVETVRQRVNSRRSRHWQDLDRRHKDAVQEVARNLGKRHK